jgi:hypothetical protein
MWGMKTVEEGPLGESYAHTATCSVRYTKSEIGISVNIPVIEGNNAANDAAIAEMKQTLDMILRNIMPHWDGARYCAVSLWVAAAQTRRHYLCDYNQYRLDFSAADSLNWTVVIRPRAEFDPTAVKADNDRRKLPAP